MHEIDPLLAEALQTVTAAIMSALKPDATDVDIGGAFQLLQQVDSVKKLLDMLAAQDEFTLFREGMRGVAGMAHRVNHEGLARWLVQRAARVGATRALHELIEYAAGADFPCTFTLAVAGPRIEAPIELGAGVMLRPYSATHFLRLTDGEDVGPVARPDEAVMRITAAFQVTVAHPKLHHSDANVASSRSQAFGESAFQSLDDARLIVALVTRRQSHPVGESALALASVPFAFEGTLLRYTISPIWPDYGVLYESLRDRVRDVHTAFTKLDRKDQARLRIPLRRLESARRAPHTPDAAIDLGIALESLFIEEEDSTSEITYRLSMRVARFLGNSLEERLRIRDDLKHIYHIRSKAAHKGVLPPKKKAGRESSEWLLHGLDLATRALIKAILEHQTENWDSLLFS